MRDGEGAVAQPLPFPLEPPLETVGSCKQINDLAITHHHHCVRKIDRKGHPGSFMFVPKGAAHRFWNDTDKPARILFTSSPPGHERYFEELAEILRRPGPPNVDAIRSLRARYDTQQLSALLAR